MSIKYMMFFVILFFSCINDKQGVGMTELQLQKISSPSKNGGEPNLFTSETGQVYLTWVEYQNDTTDVLYFSRLENKQWSEPQKIASGSDWFVNWADFPSLVAYKDDGQSLVAHWLQKSAEGTFDYDVRIAQSMDSGKSWQTSFIPHQDGVNAEHGFVSMIAISDNKIFATWLDGRNTKGEEGNDNGHGHHGSMSLRAAFFDKEGNIFDEVELDDRVCDCCQTTAAMTDQGLIVAYRDRSENEIRDIGIIRQVKGEWTKGSLVFKDNWHIAGCPVNGASIKARENIVAIAWFSSTDGVSEVKLAFSEDSGKSFYPPIRIDNGRPLGRVDIVLLSDKKALVSWLEDTDDGGLIKAVSVNRQSKISKDFVVSATSSSRKSGFPVMTNNDSLIVFAWTKVDSLTSVQTAILELE